MTMDMEASLIYMGVVYPPSATRPGGKSRDVQSVVSWCADGARQTVRTNPAYLLPTPFRYDPIVWLAATVASARCSVPSCAPGPHPDEDHLQTNRYGGYYSYGFGQNPLNVCSQCAWTAGPERRLQICENYRNKSRSNSSITSPMPSAMLISATKTAHWRRILSVSPNFRIRRSGASPPQSELKGIKLERNKAREDGWGRELSGWGKRLHGLLRR
jgi:hypothetical protein